MNKADYISTSNVVYHYFPDNFWLKKEGIVKINGVYGNSDALDAEVKGFVIDQIVWRMSQEQQRINAFTQEKLRRQPSSPDSASSALSSDILGDFDNELSITFDDIDFGGDHVEALSEIHSRDVDFILIDKSTRLTSIVFPRTFYCRKCGYFTAIDPQNPPKTLVCPSCHKAHLRQEPIVFGCSRCGNIEELSPKGMRVTTNNRTFRKKMLLNDYLNKPFTCPDCGTHHIRLEKYGKNTITRWQWKCSNPDCSYSEDLDAVCLKCALGRAPETNNSNNHVQPGFVSMSALTVTATNVLSPLTDTQMFIDNVPLNPSTLLDVARQAAGTWGDYFELDQAVSAGTIAPDDETRLRTACVEKVYLIKQLSVITTLFGYRPGEVISTPKSRIEDDEKLPTFFDDPQGIARYLCFGMQTSGSGLAISFNKEQILDRLAQTQPYYRNISYGRAMENMRYALSSHSIRRLTEDLNDERLLIFQAMHAIEHAILSNAHRLVGSDTIGSKLFMEEAIILLYEREEIGRGGVVQLVNRGAGLLSLLDATSDHVSGCAQGCSDSCPACTFINDNFCHYTFPELGIAWLPPNTLLSRTAARIILAEQ